MQSIFATTLLTLAPLVAFAQGEAVETPAGDRPDEATGTTEETTAEPARTGVMRPAEDAGVEAKRAVEEIKGDVQGFGGPLKLSEGTWMVSGSSAFLGLSVYPDPASTGSELAFNVSLNPSLVYFVRDHLGIGGSVTLGGGHAGDGYGQLGLGVVLQYYFPTDSTNFYPFIEGGAGFRTFLSSTSTANIEGHVAGGVVAALHETVGVFLQLRASGGYQFGGDHGANLDVLAGFFGVDVFL
jgi:hypothetical protein